MFNAWTFATSLSSCGEVCHQEVTYPGLECGVRVYRFLELSSDRKAGWELWIPLWLVDPLHRKMPPLMKSRKTLVAHLTASCIPAGESSWSFELKSWKQLSGCSSVLRGQPELPVLLLALCHTRQEAAQLFFPKSHEFRFCMPGFRVN